MSLNRDKCNILQIIIQKSQWWVLVIDQTTGHVGTALKPHCNYKVRPACGGHTLVTRNLCACLSMVCEDIPASL